MGNAIEFIFSLIVESFIELLFWAYKKFNPEIDEKDEKRIRRIIEYIFIFILVGALVCLTLYYAL